jgi:hypothetical protein
VNPNSFTSIVQKVLHILILALAKCDTVLDETLLIPTGPNHATHTPASSVSTATDPQNISVSALVLVSALSSLSSSHKKVVSVITNAPNFLLPALGSAMATEKVSNPDLTSLTPDMGSGASPDPQRFIRMMMAMSRGSRGSPSGYLRRSGKFTFFPLGSISFHDSSLSSHSFSLAGPALEKDTCLGVILKVGLPMDNPTVFSSFRNAATKTMADISKTNDGLRKQLILYQEAVHSLIRTWITAGEDCRKQVRWM